MSTPLVSVDKAEKMADVIGLMLKKNISAVPVMENGKLKGIITRRSLVNAL